ncbi:hypothetical protein AAVH_20584 [Aphelenchoides avenae]|nr:hypothetical protein AAVH_20584 [Aphelenchus avenae]
MQEGPWDILIDQLRKEFTRFDHTSMNMLLLKLHQCRREPTQTISSFVTKLELAAARLFQPQHHRDRTWFESAKAAVLVQNIDEEGLARDLYEVLLNEAPQMAFNIMVKKIHDYEEFREWDSLSISDVGHVARVTTDPTPNNTRQQRSRQQHNRHEGTDKLKRLRANRNRLTRKIAKIEADFPKHCATEQQSYALQRKLSGSAPECDHSDSATTTQRQDPVPQSGLIHKLELDLQRQCNRIRELQEQICDINEELFESDFTDSESEGSSTEQERASRERVVAKITPTSETTKAIRPAFGLTKESSTDLLSNDLKLRSPYLLEDRRQRMETWQQAEQQHALSDRMKQLYSQMNEDEIMHRQSAMIAAQ